MLLIENYKMTTSRDMQLSAPINYTETILLGNRCCFISLWMGMAAVTQMKICERINLEYSSVVK